MGDNLYSIGALRFLLNYYEKIYFLCRDKLLENVKLFFCDTQRIVCIPFDGNNEFGSCREIINKNYENNDIFICGYHKSYLKSKITSILDRESKNTYTIDFDTITSQNYDFIEGFYKDINLDLSIFFDYWFLPTLEESKQLYDEVKNYDIVFLQTESSNKKKLNIKKLLNKYLHDEKTILISNDENLYNNVESGEEHIKMKQQLCSHFVRNKVVYYLDTIINAKEIYIIDSCFVGIVLPLKKTNKLKAEIVRIILRQQCDIVEL